MENTLKFSHSMTRRTHLLGHTIVEMVIAVGIFVLIVTTVMETLIATRGVLGASDTEHGLELEARRVLEEITRDLSSTTWYLPMDATDKFDLLDKDLDRELRYYPYVLMQTDDAIGDRFKHFRRSDEVTRASFDQMGLDAPNEHKFHSKELVFVKFARADKTDNINNTGVSHISFDFDTTVPFDEYWNGPIVPEMFLEVTTDVVTGADIILGIELSREKNVAGNLREYSYGVRYNQSNRLHELCRYHVERVDNGQGDTTAVPVAQVISQQVDRIAFDTCRTHFALEVDQLRVQVWLSSRTANGRTISHKASLTVAMRSNVDPEYTQHIDAWLGTPGDFPVNP